MDAAIATVVAALLTGPVVALLVRFDKRNSEQHSANMSLLNDVKADLGEVKSDVKEVHKTVSKHLEWHAHNK